MTFFTTSAFYTEELLAAHPDKVFLFGDNLSGFGKGGQAAIRDCRNALGVPTKKRPNNNPEAFFYDVDFAFFVEKVVTSLNYVAGVAERLHIVVPVTQTGAISLGLGLAALDKNSPTTYRLICTYLDSLADRYGGWQSLS